MPCPLCEQRKPKRYCPAKGEKICAVCCGEKREVTIDCPSTCAYLISAHAYEREHRKPSDVEVPYPDIPVTMDLLHERRPFLAYLGYGIVVAATVNRSVDDSDAIAALTALAEKYRTLGSGLYYERPPDAPAALAVYEELSKFIANYKDDEQKHGGLGGLKDSEILKLLVFLLRAARFETNGRPRSRAFLDYLRSQMPGRPETQPEPSRIIVP
jgi:hypothetical protein